MGTPFVILATGQSNIHGESPLNWSPNSRAKIWNNIVDNDTSVGSAYSTMPTNLMGIAKRYAHNIAVADPNKDVYLIKCARGGMAITHWTGGVTMVYGGSGAGKFTLNSSPTSATVLTTSTTDANGVYRPYDYGTINVGESLWIKQGASVFKYTITGSCTWDSVSATIPISYVSSSGSLSAGGAMIELQPRFLTQIENVLPAALASAGKSTVDVVLWWQGESDSEHNSRYEIEFDFVMSYLGAKSWWSPSTHLVVCAMNSTANNGRPEADTFNSRLAALAAAGSNRHFANTPAALPGSAWADIYHMTAQGYSDAGDFIFNSVYKPSGGGGGTGTGNITGISVTTAVTVMDFSGNVNHKTIGGGTSYGLWLDGSMYPYRDGSGNKYIQIPHSENYRFKVGNWSDGYTWELQGPNLEGARQAPESAYNNRNWLGSVWSNGSTMYALMHHEWYQTMTTVAGVPGYNGYSQFNRRWVNAISWASSTDGGASFQSAPVANSSRLVLVPEPWAVQSRDMQYGFHHPSNIAKEGSYYYAAIDHRSLTADGANQICGVSLIRTTDLSQPTGWQFWNGTGWTTVNHNSYQGNLGQNVHRFFEMTNNPYVSAQYNSHMGQCLRFHTPSGKWVMFGYAGNPPGLTLGYCISPTLASPQFNTLLRATAGNNDDFNGGAARYISVFDESATDLNYQNIGNTVTVLVANGIDGTAGGFAKVKRAVMTITVDSAATATYNITPSASSVNEGGGVVFTVTTTNVGSGTLYWTLAGSATGSDFSDGQTSGTVNISGDAGSFTRTTVADSIVEGENFYMQLRVGSASGTIVANSSAVTIVDPATATYSMSQTSTTINEGGSVTYNVSTTNFGSGTLYWTTSGTISAADFSDGVTSGSVYISSNSGSFTRAVNNDVTTEGPEYFTIYLRTGSTGGPTVATAAQVTINDTSVTPPPVGSILWLRNLLNNLWLNMKNVAGYRVRNAANTGWIDKTTTLAGVAVRNATNTGWITFGGASATYAVTPSTTTVTEGGAVTYTVTTTNFGSGTLYWSMGGTVASADFSDGLMSGSVAISSNTGIITRTLSSDGLTEGAETMVLSLRTGSVSGTVVATASTVSVSDATSATYSISPNITPIGESGTVTYTITTTGFGSGTLYWTNAGTTVGADFVGGANSGEITITNNSGTLTRQLISDGQLEDVETIIIQLRTGSTAGPVVAVASTVSTIKEISYAISPNVSTVNEGGTVTYTVTATNFGSGTLYWSNAGTTVGDDFNDGLNSGSVTITNDVGTFTRVLKNDLTTEGTQTIVLTLRTGSVGGAVMATSVVVNVNDTSVTPSATIAGSISLTRNDLDFVYSSTVSRVAEPWVEIVLTVNCTNFFNYSTHPISHLVFALECRGDSSVYYSNGTRDHCGQIVRNGMPLFDGARGFIIDRAGNLKAEHWYDGAGFGLYDFGYTFNPLTTSLFTVRIRAGYRSSSSFANYMSMEIYSGTSTSGTYLGGGGVPWGWDWPGSTRFAFGGIGAGFISPNDTGCVETSAAGPSVGATAYIGNFSMTLNG